VIPLIDLAVGPSLVLILVLIAIAFGAGLVGSLIGIGGGLFIVPILVLVFGLDIHFAIAASLVAVVANSSASGASYVDQGLTNLRVGMFLECGSAVGAFLGAVLSVTLLAHHSNVLALAFVPVTVAAIVLMVTVRGESPNPHPRPDPLAQRLRLAGSYPDPDQGPVSYEVTGTKAGLSLAGVAGFGSGLLGVGGGIYNVPAMNALMNIPMRVATATSTFKIGVTATAGALVYLLAGDVYLLVAAPIAIGSLSGSLFGSHVQFRAHARFLRGLFVTALVIAAVSMAARGLGWWA
jgi:uncharacterized membrane protein YfcA